MSKIQILYHCIACWDIKSGEPFNLMGIECGVAPPGIIGLRTFDSAEAE